MTRTTKVLIVDDEPFNCELIVQHLESLGIDTLTASGGHEAIEIMEDRRCDAILLDIMMPGMSGYDVLQWLRDEDRLTDLPVIVISALDDMQNVVRCIEMGAEDYLTKPIDPVLLKARLHATLEKKRLRDQVKQQLAITRKVFGKFVPRDIATALLNGHGVLEPTLSVATILYADIEGFTALVGRKSPNDVIQILNEYFTTVTRPLERHGGVLTQFQGDAILVTFNTPVADPVHADNAVQVALEIQRTLKERTFAGVQLRTRIGIATGEVIAGSVGSGDRINFTVQGKAVNLAARLEELNKEYGSYTMLSDGTVSSLSRDYTIESVGEVEIRGLDETVQVHQLVM